MGKTHFLHQLLKDKGTYKKILNTTFVKLYQFNLEFKVKLLVLFLLISCLHTYLLKLSLLL